MEELIIGLVLAAVTGITFVAYRHPAEYRVLGVILSVITVLLLCSLTLWNTAVDRCCIELNSISNESRAQDSGAGDIKSDLALEIKDRIFNQEVYPQYGTTVGFAVLFFLWFLASLPVLGIVDKKTDGSPKEPENQEPEEIPPE